MMRPPDLELRQLRHCVAVATAGSFTRAAEDLRLSQPALSRSVQEVERQLHVRLFDRTTRAVEPTDVGSEFLIVARDILAAYDNGLGRFGSYCQGLRGTVTVAALPSLAATVLPAALTVFHAHYPEVEVNVRIEVSSEVIELVRNGNADLGLSEATQNHDDIQTTLIDLDPVVAVVGTDTQIAEQPTLSWADLARETFIEVAPGSSARRLTDLGFETAGRRPTRVLQGSTVSTAAAMVAEGLGVTAVPRTAVHLMSFVPLAVRPLTDPQLDRQVALHTRVHPRLSPAAEHLSTTLLRRGVAA